MNRKIKVLLSKVGLDAHDRGIKVVAMTLRERGMEVIYLGPHQTPEQVVSTAIQEDVDVIGISSLAGAHIYIFDEILRLLEEKKARRTLLIGGGIIPEDEAMELEKTGVSKLFLPGTPTDEIVQYIEKWAAKGKPQHRFL